jgi:orotate phosphoribosyltransferase
MGNQIEGYYEPGKKMVVIEDLISTGASSLQVADVLKQSGLEVLGMVSIFNYGFDRAKAAFDARGIPMRSLTDYTTLISLAVEKGMVSPTQQAALLQWREQPELWGQQEG